jgi:hypothetical protein
VTELDTHRDQQPEVSRYVGLPLGPWSHGPPTTTVGVATGAGLWHPPRPPAKPRSGQSPIDGDPRIRGDLSADGNT